MSETASLLLVTFIASVPLYVMQLTSVNAGSAVLVVACAGLLMYKKRKMK